MKKVVVIAGVTGMGKSALGIRLAQDLNGEIISADSVAVYKQLDIGSAKPDLISRKEVVHHMIDIKEIDGSFSVAEFQYQGRKLIDEISSRGKLPIVVGGTGLYINALIRDYHFQEEIEQPLNNSYEELNNVELHNLLVKKDNNVALSIHPNNRKRIIRALNRVEPIQKESKLLYDARVIFLHAPREVMYERINNRVDLMIQMGLIEEVKDLLSKHPSFFNYQSTNSIGYREFRAYFEGNQSLDETINLIKQNTRRFAKRQITWFKNKIQCEWVEIDDVETLHKSIKEWYKGA